MSPLYRRTSPGKRENVGAALVAAGLALGVASVSFYLVRIFLAREPLETLRKADGGGARPGIGEAVAAEAEGDRG